MTMFNKTMMLLSLYYSHVCRFSNHKGWKWCSHSILAWQMAAWSVYFVVSTCSSGFDPEEYYENEDCQRCINQSSMGKRHTRSPFNLGHHRISLVMEHALKFFCFMRTFLIVIFGFQAPQAAILSQPIGFGDLQCHQDANTSFGLLLSPEFGLRPYQLAKDWITQKNACFVIMRMRQCNTYLGDLCLLEISST